MGPAPAEHRQRTAWDARVKYAEQISEYAEYALYSAAIGAPSATALDMVSTLEAQAPKSKYLTQDAYLLVANAALQSQPDRAAVFAKKIADRAEEALNPSRQPAAHTGLSELSRPNKRDWSTTRTKELRASLTGDQR